MSSPSNKTFLLDILEEIAAIERLIEKAGESAVRQLAPGRRGLGLSSLEDSRSISELNDNIQRRLRRISKNASWSSGKSRDILARGKMTLADKADIISNSFGKGDLAEDLHSNDGEQETLRAVQTLRGLLAHPRFAPLSESERGDCRRALAEILAMPEESLAEPETARRIIGQLGLVRGEASPLPEGSDLLRAVQELREDFARHVARRNAVPSARHLDWPGVRAAGMRPSEWIREHYKDEIAAGTFRMSDLREDPDAPKRQSPLYTALLREAGQSNPKMEPADLIPQTSEIYEQRRAFWAILLGVESDHPDLSDYFNTLPRRRDLTGRSR